MSSDEKVTFHPCVGCGYCCIKTPCPVARRVYGPVDRCPALDWNGVRYVCKLMQLPGELGLRYREELHAGSGSCSPLNSWRQDVRNRDLDHELDMYKLPKEAQALIVAMAGNFMTSDKVYLVVKSWERELKRIGFNEDQIDAIVEAARSGFSENRPGYQEDLMG